MLIPQKFLRISIPYYSFNFSFLSKWFFVFGCKNFRQCKQSRRNKNTRLFEGIGFCKPDCQRIYCVTGKKLNLFQKIYFRIVQRQMKRDLKKNPDLLITDYFDPKKVKFKFDFLWFVIAAIIGPIGVLLAYTSHQTPKRDLTPKKDRITSAWLGFPILGALVWLLVYFLNQYIILFSCPFY